MRLPKRYLELDLLNLPYSLTLDETGKPITWGSTFDFVPHGYLATELFALGNGDSCGFYWPIGKEDAEPILGEIYHDNGVIVPIASNLEGLAKIKKLMGFADDEGAEEEIAEKLGVTLPNQYAEESIPATLCLEQDRNSPSSLVNAGKAALKNGDLVSAEQYLLHAIDVLPEYTEAHFYLALLYRRNPANSLKAAEAMLATITSPLVFLTDGSREQTLQWLQHLHDEDYPQLATDPIWSNRGTLSFERNAKQNNDFAIYEEAIATYLNSGQGVKAIRLRELVWELMLRETSAFRERYGYLGKKHNELLTDNLKRAGLHIRIGAARPLWN